MAKSEEEKAVIEFLESQGLDPEALAKEAAESQEGIKRLRRRIQVTRGRARDQRQVIIAQQD